MVEAPTWWAKGLLFENCNCALMCRAHIHYSNLCDHDRCTFCWAVHVDEGVYGDDCRLDGLNAFIVGETPQRMIDGDWTEGLCIDERGDAAQRAALEAIFRGGAGGPFSVLSSFVSKWLKTRFLPIHYCDEGRSKRMELGDGSAAAAKAIRGAEREREVVLTNLFNQIHGPEHVLARGGTKYRDGPLVMDTEATHAIYSRFLWSGPE